MFDSTKYAIFAVDIKIHELGNVPQLKGNFQVDYKVRGHRPKASELVGECRGLNCAMRSGTKYKYKDGRSSLDPVVESA
jgi:hypothetical protein